MMRLARSGSSRPVSQVKILFIGADRVVRRVLKKAVCDEDYQFQAVSTAAEGVRSVVRGEPDVVLLDPESVEGADSVAVEECLRQLRHANSRVPIMVLSSRTHERDKIRALDAGADDFVSKPPATGEILARIRVFLRRRDAAAGADDSRVFRAGDIEVDSAKRRVVLGGKEVHLTRTEYRLMQVLIRHLDEVLTHDQLLREVWGPTHGDQSHYIRVYMAQLRRKLEPDADKPRYLRTVPGVGYRLTTG